MQLWMERTLTGLKACDEAGADLLRKVKFGRTVRVEITVPRNVQHHRKFFALLNLVWSSAGDWPTLEDMLDELKYRLGHYERCRIVDRETGEVFDYCRLKSISFASMDQTEFDEFYEKALRELCKMAGGIKHDTLRNEVLTQLAVA